MKRIKHKSNREKPMLIAVCTPLMYCAHKLMKQARETVFCDSSSTLDQFNTSLFILSTSHPSGGIPLAAFIASDQEEETIIQGLQMIKKSASKKAFYDHGVDLGPIVIMTDDYCRKEGYSFCLS